MVSAGALGRRLSHWGLACPLLTRPPHTSTPVWGEAKATSLPPAPLAWLSSTLATCVPRPLPWLPQHGQGEPQQQVCPAHPSPPSPQSLACTGLDHTCLTLALRKGQLLPGHSHVTCPLPAQGHLCRQLPRATLAALEAAADPSLTADFKTILD